MARLFQYQDLAEPVQSSASGAVPTPPETPNLIPRVYVPRRAPVHVVSPPFVPPADARPIVAHAEWLTAPAVPVPPARKTAYLAQGYAVKSVHTFEDTGYPPLVMPMASPETYQFRRKLRHDFPATEFQVRGELPLPLPRVETPVLGSQVPQRKRPARIDPPSVSVGPITLPGTETPTLSALPQTPTIPGRKPRPIPDTNGQSQSVVAEPNVVAPPVSLADYFMPPRAKPALPHYAGFVPTINWQLADSWMRSDDPLPVRSRQRNAIEGITFLNPTVWQWVEGWMRETEQIPVRQRRTLPHPDGLRVDEAPPPTAKTSFLIPAPELPHRRDRTPWTGEATRPDTVPPTPIGTVVLDAAPPLPQRPKRSPTLGEAPFGDASIQPASAQPWPVLEGSPRPARRLTQHDIYNTAASQFTELPELPVLPQPAGPEAVRLRFRLRSDQLYAETLGATAPARDPAPAINFTQFPDPFRFRRRQVWLEPLIGSWGILTAYRVVGEVVFTARATGYRLTATLQRYAFDAFPMADTFDARREDQR